ncbi:MAG: radical SAM protein [Flavobacteriales bacterium]|jgi:radical SAM superfamily enzyme YgiQ (UPF0313 family)|nr:radical SAM protein [Flavobacteriales bacterium]
MAEILLITPPFTQLNTPYPATAYLKGFLNTKGIDSRQMDLGIETILRLFSAQYLTEIFEIAEYNFEDFSENAQRIFFQKEQYLQSIDAVISFLQGKNSAIARKICQLNYLPKASRFDQLEDLDWSFGNMGIQDRAKHLATLYLEDLSDFIVECIDPNFGFSRYAEKLGLSANSFDEIYQFLQSDLSFVEQISIDLLEEAIQKHQPKLLTISIPFPGNLILALRFGAYAKKKYPNMVISIGGGFPNTELRSLKDTRVFDFVDFITLDDGELPVELLYQFVKSEKKKSNFPFKRTFYEENGKVVYCNKSEQKDYRMSETGTPDYTDLPLDQYISVIEVANPMHSLWSDGVWNKLTMAHGCYWAKCTFCDTSLDYIKTYYPLKAKILVDRMEELVAQTQNTGFHFVDEAAPPILMRELALEILKRRLQVTWWTNIRFEKSFSQDLCTLLAASGCIAVSGGLEVASDRLLKLINKGVTVEQVAQVTQAFTKAGIMVHSYLMYGYPSQTEQETIDSLELVRQIFELGIIQSGFWHQFALTSHSPIGKTPEEYGILPKKEEILFADNDVQFEDSTRIDHSKFSFGLKKSIYNYMHGVGFDFPIQEWFDFPIPQTTIAPQLIESYLEKETFHVIKPTQKVIWIGQIPFVSHHSKKKKGNVFESIQLHFYLPNGKVSISFDKEIGVWWVAKLSDLSPQNEKKTTFSQLKSSFDLPNQDFEMMWYSKSVNKLRSCGLLVL